MRDRYVPSPYEEMTQGQILEKYRGGKKYHDQAIKDLVTKQEKEAANQGFQPRKIVGVAPDGTFIYQEEPPPDPSEQFIPARNRGGRRHRHSPQRTGGRR